MFSFTILFLLRQCVSSDYIYLRRFSAELPLGTPTISAAIPTTIFTTQLSPLTSQTSQSASPNNLPSHPFTAPSPFKHFRLVVVASAFGCRWRWWFSCAAATRIARRTAATTDNGAAPPSAPPYPGWRWSRRAAASIASPMTIRRRYRRLIRRNPIPDTFPMPTRFLLPPKNPAEDSGDSGLRRTRAEEG